MAMTSHLREEDIIFSNASINVNAVARQTRHVPTAQSLVRRLDSIESDSVYVKKFANIVKLPLVANERCGSWYVDPVHKAASAYFKSTDGHAGQWAFSLRRLNLQIMELIGIRHGCLIVDSTKRGKHAPDALAKTVPIWCAVFNRLLFPELVQSHALRVHPNLVSDSERAQIEARLPWFVEQTKVSFPEILTLCSSHELFSL